MADVSVRGARAGDVAEIARIQVETWRFSYADTLPAAALEALTVEAAAEAWQPAVTAPPTPRHRVLAAQEGEWTVGFTAFGPADDLQPDEAEAQTTIAVGPLIVEPRWRRRGHGSRLMAATVDLARSDGMTRAVAWVPEADTGTREFLIGAGWAADGLVRALDTGAGELRELRLFVSLAEG
ncbi:GNAT family N-acetyltransferase [Jatrophihabitans sp.]|uniref:GNAT family N-acetyltransferase n=1 Tax=Jatrophihabitans sp. TaxID=1932789 RepID=UPI0030C6C594|nr:acyltransferase [Jatrophihabitans sp.]